MTKGEAQYIASLWHGGQNSSLYAFCSSGHVDDFLEIEIENCLSQVPLGMPDRRELQRLLDYIKGRG